MTWLSPRDAARLAAVTPKTLTRWASQGLVTVQMTTGGQRRYERDSLLAAKRLQGERRGALAFGDAAAELVVTADDITAAEDGTVRPARRRAMPATPATRHEVALARMRSEVRTKTAPRKDDADPWLRDYDGRIVEGLDGPILRDEVACSVWVHVAVRRGLDPRAADWPSSLRPGERENPAPPHDCDACNPDGAWPDPRFARDRMLRASDMCDAAIELESKRAELERLRADAEEQRARRERATPQARARVASAERAERLDDIERQAIALDAEARGAASVRDPILRAALGAFKQ